MSRTPWNTEIVYENGDRKAFFLSRGRSWVQCLTGEKFHSAFFSGGWDCNDWFYIHISSPAQSGLFFFLFNYPTYSLFAGSLVCFHVIASMVFLYQLLRAWLVPLFFSLFHYTFMFIGAPCYYGTIRVFTDRHSTIMGYYSKESLVCKRIKEGSSQPSDAILPI